MVVGGKRGHRARKMWRVDTVEASCEEQALDLPDMETAAGAGLAPGPCSVRM